ncbi:MAG: hypothetical protein BRC30_00485, partial [Nanohaloarchaea archaeon SW_7_46_7]
IEVNSVSSSTSAAVTVDGETESVETGDTVGESGNLRVSDIYRTGPDGEGRVAFSAGSNELTIEEGGSVEIDGDDVDGVDVMIDSDADTGGTFSAVDGMTFAFGADDSDSDYVEAGSKYETPLFGLEFRYGGLSGDVVENPAEALELTAQEDSVSEFTFTKDGEEVSVDVAEPVADTTSNFGNEDGTIAQYEGQSVAEDDFVVLNSNEEADMYEVTDVDDTDLVDEDEDGTVTVTLENVVTGETVEVEEDGEDFSDSSVLNGDGTYTIESESIEGKDFDVTFESSANDNTDEVSFVRTTRDSGHAQLWPHLYTATDSAVAFDAPDQSDTDGDGSIEDAGLIEPGNVFDASSDFTTTQNFSTNDEKITLDTSGNSNYVKVEVSDGSNTEVLEADGSTATTSETYNGDVDVEILAADDTKDFTLEDQSAGDSYTLSSSEVTRTADIPSGVASNDATAT